MLQRFEFIKVPMWKNGIRHWPERSALPDWLIHWIHFPMGCTLSQFVHLYFLSTNVFIDIDVDSSMLIPIFRLPEYEKTYSFFRR